MAAFNATAKLFADCLLRMATEEGKTLLESVFKEESGVGPLERVITPALENIGQMWEEGVISLSQVYMAGRICENLINELLPSLQTLHGSHPKIAICVLEDFHALGKRLVMSTLRSTGYHLSDLGHGLNAADLVERTQQENVEILLISCLLLSSARRVKDVVQGLEKVGSKTVVVVGGAPFRLDPQLWKEVGADYMGSNSSDAVRIVKNIMERRLWQ
nr:cobalamin-dependent protein [uncultured Desulfobulbus sp.]